MYCAAFTHHDEALHQALRMKSAVLGQSISDLVNEAMKLSLGEDAEDFAVGLAEKELAAEIFGFNGVAGKGDVLFVKAGLDEH